MGIAINYNFVFKGSKDKLLEILKNIREEIKKLDVEDVGNIVETSKVSVSRGANDSDALALRLFFSMQAEFDKNKLPNEDMNLYQQRISKEVNGVGFYVIVSEDCEPVSIILCRFGDSDKWSGFAFTKTMGAEDFIKAHKTVIEILKICESKEILESVIDEAEIWEDSQ